MDFFEGRDDSQLFEGEPEGEVQDIFFEDLDNDGTPDTIMSLIDSDNDGQADEVVAITDTDGDGIPDMIATAMDLDGDGQVDVFQIDMDADGHVDIVGTITSDDHGMLAHSGIDSDDDFDAYDDSYDDDGGILI